ncbi:MAG: OmpA family protein [Bacteroidetes bacterium]|nr:OmpA family protein [Bacteroidota bacterium]
MRRILLLFVLTTLTILGFAQKKPSAIGFSFNLVDFQTPTDIKNTSLHDVLKSGDWHKGARLDPSFSLVYWKGLTNHLDVSARYNGIFGSNTLSGLTNKSDLQEYYNELEAALHARALKSTAVVNPFLTAGLGVGNYWKNFGLAPYAPLGVGLEVNIASEAFIHILANYRLSFDNKKLPNNLFYSLGVSQSLGKPKEKVIPPPPIPVVVNIDKDNDGVVDSIDACPDVAGIASLKGCPDKDGDGIADKEDKCPDVPGLARYQGCPIPDSDKDGINDEEDKCPNLAGVKENQGCPIIKEEIKKKIELAAKNIYFATGSAKLLAKSYKGLNEVVKILNEDPGMKLAIDGHTDNTGKADKNQILSENRAAAVKAYLVSKGIDESRLTAVGHGQDQPIADNKTAAGRAKNRRVEMTLNYWITETK